MMNHATLLCRLEAFSAADDHRRTPFAWRMALLFVDRADHAADGLMAFAARKTNRCRQLF